MSLTAPYSCTSNCVYPKEVVLVVKPGEDFNFINPIFEHGVVIAGSVEGLISGKVEKINMRSRGSTDSINLAGKNLKYELEFNGLPSSKNNIVHIMNKK